MEIKHLKDASPTFTFCESECTFTFTFCECSLGQEGLMLSDGIQRSLGVSILNHNIRQLMGRQRWQNRCSFPPPDFHLGSFFLFLSHKEALSFATSHTSNCSLLFSYHSKGYKHSPRNWAGNPLQPIHQVYIHFP